MGVQIYTHTKTGNLYTYLGVASPIDKEPTYYSSKYEAKSCEDTDFKVEIFNVYGRLFYLSRYKEILTTNIDGLLVVYSRENNIWLRCKHDFFRFILLDGKVVPRFSDKVFSFSGYISEYTADSGEVYYVINYLDSLLTDLFLGGQGSYLTLRSERGVSDEFIYLSDLECLNKSKAIWGFKYREDAVMLILSLLGFEIHSKKSIVSNGKQV